MRHQILHIHIYSVATRSGESPTMPCYLGTKLHFRLDHSQDVQLHALPPPPPPIMRSCGTVIASFKVFNVQL